MKSLLILQSAFNIDPERRHMIQGEQRGMQRSPKQENPTNVAGGRGSGARPFRQSYFAYLKNLASVLVTLIAVAAQLRGWEKGETPTCELALSRFCNYCACAKGLEAVSESSAQACPD